MDNINISGPRCVTCYDDGTIDNGQGERIPCYMCQFVNGYPRPVVVRFADDMEQRLKENDHKGGWDNESKQYLATILAKATTDLLKTLAENGGVQLVTTRAADVANIAMMIANNEQMGAWPKSGVVIQDMDTGKFLKYDEYGPDNFPFVYVDTWDKSERYETLHHAMHVAYWGGEVGRRYRVIDYNDGGVQYIHVGGGAWWVEDHTKVESVPIPADRLTRFDEKGTSQQIVDMLPRHGQ